MQNKPSCVKSDLRSELVFELHFGGLYFWKANNTWAWIVPWAFTQYNGHISVVKSQNSIICNWIKTSTIAVWISRKPTFSGKVGQVRFKRMNNAFRDFKITYDLTERQKGTFAVRKHLFVLSQRVLHAVPSLFVYAGSPRGRIKAERYRRCNGLLRDRW